MPTCGTMPTNRAHDICMCGMALRSTSGLSQQCTASSIPIYVVLSLHNTLTVSSHTTQSGRRTNMQLTSPCRHNMPLLVAVLVLAAAAAAARADGALCDKSDKAALLAIKSAL